VRKITLALTILGSLVVLADAGAAQYSSGETETTQEVASVAPPCHEWAGFYVGGFLGYKYGIFDVNLDPNGSWDNTVARDDIRNHSFDNLDTSGAEMGGIVGFNWQFNDCWVAGLEANMGYLWLRNSEDSGTFAVTGFTPKSVQSSFKTHYLFTFAPRIGYAFGSWLPYVTGGLAVGDLDFGQRLHNVSPNGPYHTSGEVNESHAGWMLGGGLQYAVDNHWTVRAQYEYVDLGSVSFQAAGSTGFTGFSSHNEASLDEHNASVAIIYGF
jgi:outer membrane immunogenic protein